MQKKAIEYRRYSKDKQSNFSLERQEAINRFWTDHNNILITDVFSDDGISARNFDRPDVQRLFAFIKKNYRQIDYLIVSELTRFSRELGEAVNTIKEIQTKYNVKIVSCSKGMVYDVTEHSSFIMMALEFTFGNAENIKRQNDINGGIYTAKAESGRWIGGHTPYGYTKQGDRIKELIAEPSQAAIVQFIFNSYANGTQLKIIQQQAKEMGYTIKGQSVIQNMLCNPVYIGKQQVKPYKDLPGGLFTGTWLPLIDMITWQQVQDRLTGKKAKGISISDNFPLRGVVKCENGEYLTGAPSRGRGGKYYNYYKCKCRRHLNISASFAHEQLNEIMALLSVPADLIGNLYEATTQLLQDDIQANKKQLMLSRTQLTTTQTKLHSLEEKFISNLVSPETYSRWHSDYTQQIHQHQATIEGLANMDKQHSFLLMDNLQALTDVQGLYNSAPVQLQQEWLNTVFDSKLYYKERSYRTTYIMPVLAYNELELRRKGLLLIEKSPEFSGNSGRVELQVPLSNRLPSLLSLVDLIKRA